jgi:hypothetical protein
MRIVFVVVLALTTPSMQVGAQTHPDFSGSWRYQTPVQSAKAGNTSPVPTAGWGAPLQTFVIKQTASELTLESGSTRWVYKLDSSENVIPDPGNKDPGGPYPYKTKARWDGAKLLLYTRQGLNQMRDILALNGGILDIIRDTEVPAGSGIAIPLVYTKTP